MSDKEFLSLYEKILLIRLTDEEIARRYPEQEMRCPVHLSIGQEAVAAGVCANLRKRDIVYSTHRCHAHYLAKGGNLDKMIAEIYGKETGCSKGKGGSQHLIDLEAGFGASTPIVGNSMPVATGAAFAHKLQGMHVVTVAFIGDGTAEEGVFHESINFAALKQLPILYVCENNFFSVYTHLSERQPQRPIYKLAAAHGIPASRHDGNDAVGVFKTARTAVEHIRKGRGPVFLEYLTYRHREHCGPNFDDDLGYRNKKEAAFWKEKDPVIRFKSYLLKKKIASPAILNTIENGLKKNIEKAFEFARKSRFPIKESLFEELYAS